jgi:hypothetical protein
MMSIILPKVEFKKRTFKADLIKYFKTNPMNIKKDAKGDINLNLHQITWLINNFERKKIYYTLPFGKYKGKYIKDIAKFDKKYLKWFADQDCLCDGDKLRKEIYRCI